LCEEKVNQYNYFKFLKGQQTIIIPVKLARKCGIKLSMQHLKLEVKEVKIFNNMKE
jgi:hypothetical protein